MPSTKEASAFYLGSAGPASRLYLGNTMVWEPPTTGGGTGTAVRTNWTRNPAMASTSNYTTPNSRATLTVEAGAGQFGENRLVVTTAVNGYFPRASTAQVPVTAGETWTASVYVATTQSTTHRLALDWLNDANTSVGGAEAATSNVSGARLTLTAVAPVGATRVIVYLGVPNNSPVGYLAKFSALLLEKASTVGTYFNGGTPDTTDVTYAWAGVANDSTSTMTTVTAAPTPVGGPGTFPTRYVDGSEPWRLQAGETYLDGMPSGVPIIQASNYSTSSELRTVLEAIEASSSPAGYVQLEAKTYTISNMKDYGTNDYRGWTNGNRKIMGLIGAPAVNGLQTTKIVSTATMISSTAGATAYTISGPSSPVSNTGLYFSNTSTTIPIFISGIDFKGRLQTPYTVYQGGGLSTNAGVASPLAWRGMAIWRSIEGAKFQFNRMRGFGFSLKNSPPYEMGLIDTNYDDGMIYRRNEFDGRIAADIDAAQPRAVGSIMVNKGVDFTIENSWQHHTRTSGFATNTNTNRDDELYKVRNFQVEEVANGTDGWARTGTGFSGSNIEEVIGVFDYTNFRVTTLYPSGYHIAYALPASGANGSYTSPTRPVIKLRGFRTDNTQFGGCLVIMVSQQPNSTGQSPAWQRVNTLGIAGSNLFDIRREDGTALTGVKSTSWVSSMTPNTHFVVVY